MQTQFHVTPKLCSDSIMLFLTFENNTVLEGAADILDDHQKQNGIAIKIMVPNQG